ncbi:LytTR family transcriptional regulator DNA-binding domain-containing protein [Sphingobacterium sp.]|uniref:LytTR family transcriptional regulator DNA-binding domain-containing protein n=1 Tax=Sphingobacterium sp. TaxID=341027 RepID=UPI002587ED14|nr:LytTR family transcriptional regulator DNA-binding domain-containing protein [Sphingobacterium sp.]WET69098.1 MAG: LytTR family transcriptional regulator DNA-binding domain-containing protein [Sphingobacterium sp.]
MALSIKYGTFLFRFTIALCAAIYLLFHGRSVNLAEALSSPTFYVAFLISFIISIIIVHQIHYITVWLDTLYDWFSQAISRAIVQLLLAVIFPLLIDFVALAFYFDLMGTSIFMNGFIKYDLPIIICLILLLNCYYLIFHIYTKKANDNSQLEHSTNSPPFIGVLDANIENEKVENETAALVRQDSSSDDMLPINHAGINASFHIRTDIVYFFRKDRKMHAVTIHGNTYPFIMNIEDLEHDYNNIGLCRINRTVIVNCNMVRGYTIGSKRNTLMVILIPAYTTKLPQNYTDHFLITRGYHKQFKNLFEHV